MLRPPYSTRIYDSVWPNTTNLTNGNGLIIGRIMHNVNGPGPACCCEPLRALASPCEPFASHSVSELCACAAVFNYQLYVV